ncbi:MAG TPA: sigma-70 family RNA polymerase sigma factor [Chryseolinea sp.]|nr:sigma-70 family RNA polymerase sigma factor [Chryseolinea sp.]
MFVTFDSEEETVRALNQGDEAAFLKIYELYWYKIYLIAYRRLGKKEIAEELTQDLFLKLWEKRNTLKPQKIDNYLCVAIKNAVIDHIHSALVANRYLDFHKAYGESASRQTQDTVEFDDLSYAIEKGLSNLPRKTQEVFKLSRLNSWAPEKIAKHLNLSEKTVGYHLTKSLKFMRAYLREYLLMGLYVVLIQAEFFAESIPINNFI